MLKMKDFLFVLCVCFIFSCSSSTSEVGEKKGIGNNQSLEQTKLHVQDVPKEEQKITASIIKQNATKQISDNTINPSKTSFEVKYFISEIDKLVSLSTEQRNVLTELATTNITSKLALEKQLKSTTIDPVEKKRIRANIVEKIKEEQKNLEKTLTSEQYNIYEKDKKVRKANNQLKNMSSLLSLSEKQKNSIRELIIDSNFNNESIATKLQEAKKDKMKYASLIKKRKIVKQRFGETISEILSEEQYKVYSESKYSNLFGVKSK